MTPLANITDERRADIERFCDTKRITFEALESADRIELVGVLERLTQATQMLVDSLSADAASHPRGESPAATPQSGSPGLGAVRDALREHDAG